MCVGKHERHLLSRYAADISKQAVFQTGREQLKWDFDVRFTVHFKSFYIISLWFGWGMSITPYTCIRKNVFHKREFRIFLFLFHCVIASIRNIERYACKHVNIDICLYMRCICVYLNCIRRLDLYLSISINHRFAGKVLYDAYISSHISRCWRIFTEPFYWIQIKVIYIDLESHPECDYDNLKIYAGGYIWTNCQYLKPYISEIVGMPLPD